MSKLLDLFGVATEEELIEYVNDPKHQEEPLVKEFWMLVYATGKDK